jgi:beta-aspartyl-peptidase (threonine type)
MAETSAMGGTGGVILTGPAGDMTWSFNTPGMYRGKVSSGSKRVVAIYGDED